MPRTTLDIDAPILDELKRLAAREHKSLGRLVSDLVASALPRHGDEPAALLEWRASAGRVVVDLLDKDAVYALLDAEKVHG
jgi:hypothetical protein